jgi:hypothetical protein
MAAGSSGTGAEAMTAGRRFAIGANVAIAIVTAAALLVAVNWICSLTYVRKDLASFAHYGLSDRTKQILDGYPEDIHVSLLYTPDQEDEEQQEYIDRLLDYGDEMRRYGPQMTVTHVATDSHREKLVARLGSAFGDEADQHRQALDSFRRLAEDLDAELEQRLAASTELMAGDSWLGDFPLFASVVSTLRVDRGALKKAGEEIAELTPAGGIPKYQDATTRAKGALKEVREHFQAIADSMSRLTTLADETSRPDSVYITMLRRVASKAHEAVASLRQLVGQADDPLPDDIAAALKAYADRGEEVGGGLGILVRRVNDFGRKFPIVQQHPNWSANVRLGPLTMRQGVAGVLQEAGKTLQRSRLLILGVIDTGDPEQLRQTLVNARNDVRLLEQNASACEQLLAGLADRLASVDQASQALLDEARDGSLLADQVAAIDALAKETEDLPELTLGSVADQLKEDNVVVVEANRKLRVVSFAEVFPVRESVAGPGASSEELDRTFNGDSAMSSAILALTREHAFATVVLTSFEPPPPPQRQQFMPPPPQSRIPSRALSEVRRRLEAANFKVVDWNLATTDEMPTPEEGTENVYLVLPPAPPAQPNPFNRQAPPGPTFGQEHRDKIRQLLDEDARMLFLASWEVSGGGMFGGPPRTPPYGYGPLLSKDWGINVDNGRRVVWIKPDRQKEDTLMVVLSRFNHMPAGGFLDHPIGSPMRGTRFLILDACPLETQEALPEGVTVEPVLRISARENYIGTELPDLIRIIDKLRNTRSEGRVTLKPFPPHGPFDVMVAAERHEGDKSKGKLVVMGFGGSLRDQYLTNPVMSGGDVLRLDPPPTENADLLVNALYWLQGQTRWIARGPVPVPRVVPIEAGQMIALRVFVWGVWPAVVFAPGILLWWIRRR